MTRPTLALLLVCGLRGTPLLAAGPRADEVRFELGGLRQVTATLGGAEGEYRVTVRMLPVKSFDPATNGELNREKARAYALHALALHLGGKTAGRLTVRGAEVIDVASDGKFYTLTLRVPKDGIQVEGGRPMPPAGQVGTDKKGAERLATTSALLTRKQDYLDTLQRLTDATTTRLQDADRRSRAAGDKGRSFWAVVADLEERSEANVKKLGKEIDGDLLLLVVEKTELLRAVERQQDETLHTLKEAVRKREREAQKEKSP